MNIKEITRRVFLKQAGSVAAALAIPNVILSFSGRDERRPNILFALADDWSWPHASIAYKMGIPGTDSVVKTPAFDRVAREGICFTNAYVCAPSCSPSRASILTGRYIWQLETAANLRGVLPAKFAVYPEILADAGYHVGYMHKGWAPGPLGNRVQNPAGPKYNNFDEFIRKRPKETPFCFWFGSWDAHRGYVKDSGINSGMKPENVTVPACLPDNMTVRKDICDYYFEVQRFDRDVGNMLKLLEEKGELENTIVVISGDNGFPFPRCKVELYDTGTRVPLAIRWGKKIKGGRVVNDFINLAELGPTFLEVVGLEVADTMTAPSFVNILMSDKEGRVDPLRNKVFTGVEYHDFNCRKPDVGYPSRTVRNDEFLYICNFAPNRYPAGDPIEYRKERGPYGEIDPSPTKTYMIEHKNDPQIKKLFKLAFGKRPAEELYDLRKDPGQLQNIAYLSEYAESKKKMANILMKGLKSMGDPRALGKKNAFKFRWNPQKAKLPWKRKQQDVNF